MYGRLSVAAPREASPIFDLLPSACNGPLKTIVTTALRTEARRAPAGAGTEARPYNTLRG